MPNTQPIPVVLAGATGKTGSAVGKAVWDAHDMELAAAVARRHRGVSLGLLWGIPELTVTLTADLAEIERDYAVLVDFTEPESAYPRLVEAISRGWDIVVGTTGFSRREREHLAELVESRQVGAAVIANFSLGAWVAERLAIEASRYLGQVEVIEGHHQTKKDRPSGTAKRMAELLADAMGRDVDSIPVHSIRLPGMVAHQAVVFGSSGQLITIRHDVHDRSAYAAGVLAAIRQVHTFRGRVVNDLGEILDPGRLRPDGP